MTKHIYSRRVSSKLVDETSALSQLIELY